MLEHMNRTTVRLDDDLVRQAKQYALDTGQTLTALIDSALREKLARGSAKSPSRSVRLKTFRGTGLQDGVDLDNAANLLDAMESAD